MWSVCGRLLWIPILQRYMQYDFGYCKHPPLKLEKPWKCHASGFMNPFNSFQPKVAFLIQTSHLVCLVNKRTRLYMKCSTGLKNRLRPMFASYRNRLHLYLSWLILHNGSIIHKWVRGINSIQLLLQDLWQTIVFLLFIILTSIFSFWTW